jgi:hypothetical protein
VRTKERAVYSAAIEKFGGRPVVKGRLGGPGASAFAEESKRRRPRCRAASTRALAIARALYLVIQLTIALQAALRTPSLAVIRTSTRP